MVKTNSITSRMVLVERIVGSAYDIEGLNEELTAYAQKNGADAMKTLAVLNVLHEVPRVDVFPLEEVKGDIYFNDMNYPSSEGVFILHDYSDREFSDSDELNEFVKEEIKRGMLTIQEAKCLDITYREESKPDLDIEVDEDEWRLDVQKFEPKHTETMDMMGIAYVPEHEARKANELLQQEIGELNKESQEAQAEGTRQKAPEDMSDDEISFELNKLETRLHILYKEQRLRKS